MKWPLGSECATLTWAIINSESLQMNRDPIAWRKWGLFPYHPGGECAGSENGSSVDCLTVGLIRSRDLFSGQRVRRTQRKNIPTWRGLHRKTGSRPVHSTGHRGFPAASPAHVWAFRPTGQGLQTAVCTYLASQPLRESDLISEIIMLITTSWKLNHGSA
jgi:hypothetical protein